MRNKNLTFRYWCRYCDTYIIISSEYVNEERGNEVYCPKCWAKNHKRKMLKVSEGN